MITPSNPTPSRKFDVVVVGGGAAGFFAAIQCAEAAPNAKVLILEKSKQLLAKVRISGGGRCNVTHSCFDPSELTKRYPRGNRELRGPFHTWQPEDTVSWFESRGVKLKTENDGRMFPITDQSQTIVDCLFDAAQKAGVSIWTQVGLTQIKPLEDSNFRLTLSDRQTLETSSVLIAVGGLKNNSFTDILEQLGHSIAPLAPSLFTFKIEDERINDLQGLSVPCAEVSIPGTKLNQLGPTLITHWGLSGPAVLKLSAWGARWIQEQDYRFTCRVNWSPTHNTDSARSALLDFARTQAKSKVWNLPAFEIPARLWQRLAAASGIQKDAIWGQQAKARLRALAQEITHCEFAVAGKSMFKEEFVTCGGISLKEINFKTMESRIVPGLHFAGETLDIDGITGGFNFQSAWTTGTLAGRAMAAKFNTRSA